MRKASPVLLALFLLLFSTSVASAQFPETVLFAAVDGDTLYISRVNSGETRTEIIFTEGQYYANLQWDPQLLWFIFTYIDEEGRIILAASDNMGWPGFALAEDIATIPPSFDAYGNEIVYAVEAGENRVDVYALHVNGFAGFADEGGIKIATIPYDMDCQGERVIAPQIALAKEYGISGDFSLPKQLLFLSPHGLIHNEGCAATKTLLTDLDTGETVEIAENLQWAVPSRDGSLLAGISDGQLVIATTDGSHYEAQPTSAPPTYPIVWGDQDHPNSLIYTTRERNGRRSLDAADEQLVLDAAGEEALGFWSVGIYEYNLATYSDREVYSQVAYGIGSMRMVMGNALVFSEIPALRPWVDGIIAGEITDAYDDLTIGVNLYRLDLETRRRTLVAENIRQSCMSWNAAMG